MTKEEKKNEMKNRISMALKDPILQQGFEIICKNLAELETENNKLLDVINNQDVKIADLEKENTILKDRTEEFEKQILGLLYKYKSVYERFPDLKDAMTEAEKVLKENTELDMKRKAERQIFQGIVEKKNEQLTKAKEILQLFLKLKITPCASGNSINMFQFENVCNQAEQFLKEIEK